MSNTYFSKQMFEYRKIIGAPTTLEDLEFSQCEFEGGALAQYDDPACGFVVKNVRLHRCRVGNVGIHGVRFEDVTIDGLANRNLIHIEASLFKHVTLRGRIGRIMTLAPNSALPQDVQAKFSTAAAEFFDTVDWALDVSQAEFSDAEFTHVPGHLIRRDPATQFLIHKKLASALERDSLPSYAQIVVERAMASPYESIVAVAPTRSKNFERDRRELERLRELGVAE